MTKPNGRVLRPIAELRLEEAQAIQETFDDEVRQSRLASLQHHIDELKYSKVTSVVLPVLKASEPKVYLYSPSKSRARWKRRPNTYRRLSQPWLNAGRKYERT